jgi:hypothetical protein
MLDTPLGKFSIRQTVILLALALASYMLTLPFPDLLQKLIVAGAAFVVGASFFLRRIKTISPERHLLLVLGIGRPLKRRKPVKEKGGKRAKRAEEEKRPKSMVVSAALETPVKLVGVLRDPVHGSLLPNRSFEVYVGDKLHSKGVTDEQGFFNIFFVPDRYGEFTLEVRPEGIVGASEKIVVNVKPRGGAEVV